jgi:hypothetical protein
VPVLFAEIRLQLMVVAVFLVSCVFNSFLAGRPRTVWTATVRAGNPLLGLITVFLALNYLLYMGTLEYGALTGTDFDSSLLTTSFGQAGGFPMSLYDPAYGFVVFLLSCLILVWISLRQDDTI